MGDVRLNARLRLCGGLGPQLYAVPALDLVFQDLVDQFVLFDDRHALELGAFDIERVHGTATTANVLDLLHRKKNC